jgi:hypothetical protein
MSKDQTEILVDTYGTVAPDAAKFGVGATTQADVKRATDARTELSDQQSNPGRGPVRRDS